MGEDAEGKDRSTLTLILALGLLGMMGGALMGPVLPAISSHFGVGSAPVKLVITVYAAATAISFPFMGFFTDRYGRKKVLIPSFILNGTAGIICALAPNLPILLVARAIQGIGIAGMAPMALILIGDLYDGPGRAEAMGGLSSIRASGGVIAPLIGGILATLSWNYPFIVYTASFPLALAFWLWFPFPDKSVSISIGEYLEPMKEALKNPRVEAVLILSFQSFFLVYTMVAFIPERLVADFGMSNALAGAFQAISAVATISIAVHSGRLVERTQKSYLIGLGFLISGIGFLILPFRNILLWIALSLVVFGLGRGLLQPQINTLVTEVAPEGRLGGVASLNSIAKYGGQMAAPFALGMIKAFTSFQVVFLISGLIGIGTGIVALILALSKSSSNQ